MNTAKFKCLSDEIISRYERRKPSPHDIKNVGDRLDDIAQRIEQEKAWEAARNRSREEWERLEYEYIPHATALSYEDLWANILDLIEHRRITPQIGRKRLAMIALDYSMCEYVFCHNVFPAKGNKRYCCRDCKDAQREAERRYRANKERFHAPTYLPESAYIPRMADSERRAYEENEFPANPLDESDNGDSNSLLDVYAYGSSRRDDKRIIRDINGDYRRRDGRKRDRKRGRVILRVGIQEEKIEKCEKYFGESEKKGGNRPIRWVVLRQLAVAAIFFARSCEEKITN